MNVRERTQEIEKMTLSKFATLSSNSKGRVYLEEECSIRTPFQHDKDKIVNDNSFRRMKFKTQVFLIPEGDHFRTRLTHTMEVAQVARTIARALRLNEDLAEAIALAHDLGHPPFGHAGERALTEVCSFPFRHYEQSLREVDLLANNGAGLNLTHEVREGILNHTSLGNPSTLEGKIVRISDRIAYINHDIDDAIRAGILKDSDLPRNAIEVLGKSGSERINTLINSVVENSQDDIKLNYEIQSALNKIYEFVLVNVYQSPKVREQEERAQDLLKTLYNYFIKHPDSLPDESKRVYERDGIDRAVCDYIAGMTDRFAVRLFRSLYIPSRWY